MPHQLDYCATPHHTSEGVGHVITASVVLIVNMFFVTLAIWWSEINWIEYKASRGHWGDGILTIAWLAGTAVLLTLQFLLGLWPSCLIQRRKRTVAKWLRRAVILCACASILITIGGVAAIFINDVITPPVHHPGM